MGIRILLLLLLWSAPVVSYSPGCKVSSSLSKETGFESRRGFLSSASAAVLATAPILLGPQYVFAEEDLVDYQDAECKFSIKVPSGWEKSVQSLPDRRKIVLFVKPGSEQKTFVFVAYSPVRSDFTSLGSFGSVDEVSRSGPILYFVSGFSLYPHSILRYRSLRLQFCRRPPLQE